MIGKKTKPFDGVQDGLKGSAIPAPNGYGVRGGTSVDADAVRKDTAKTPASLGPRD